MERLEQIDLDCIYRAVECPERDRKEKALQFFENFVIPNHQNTHKERERKREISPTRARQLSLSLSLTSGRIREEEEDDDERRRRGR